MLRIRHLNLPPDVFAVAMATGIVSVAALQHHYPRISAVTAVAATTIFVVLAVGFVARFLAGPGGVLAQADDPDVALRMFTALASCAVLGVRWVDHPAIVWFLGALALAGWIVLGPLAVRDVRAREPTELRDHAHGAWLLPSVAAAGLATTAADLAVDVRTDWLVGAAAAAWLLGMLLYLAVTWLVAWRAVAAPFVPESVTPDSWILMGALAITNVAGDHLLVAIHTVGGPSWLAAAARPTTLVAWAAASVWIPVLLYAEVWRMDRRVGSLHYEGAWWSAVFPMGMYSVASQSTAVELHMPSLVTISLVFFWIAVTAWVMVALGSAHRLIVVQLARPRMHHRPAA